LKDADQIKEDERSEKLNNRREELKKKKRNFKVRRE